MVYSSIVEMPPQLREVPEQQGSRSAAGAERTATSGPNHPPTRKLFVFLWSLEGNSVCSKSKENKNHSDKSQRVD